MLNQKILSKVAQIWIPLALVFTVGIGFAYIAVQQSYRQGAEDPQAQYVQEAITAITNGADPRSMVPTEKIDIATSLSPFIMVFDVAGNLLASSAVLDGKPVQPPKGALDWTVEHGENRITWQPRPGVRQALVIRRAGGNRDDIIVAGRSLREVESRVAKLGIMALIAWIVGMGTSLIATFSIATIRERKNP